MNATLEAPKPIEEEVRQKTQEQIDAFTMPRPMKGQSVLWYPGGTLASKPEVGWVLNRGARNIVIQVGSALSRDSVRHVDDPKLKLSSDQRESGAWDFTDDWKVTRDMPAKLEAAEAKIAMLETRLKALEELITK